MDKKETKLMSVMLPSRTHTALKMRALEDGKTLRTMFVEMIDLFLEMKAKDDLFGDDDD